MKRRAAEILIWILSFCILAAVGIAAARTYQEIQNTLKREQAQTETLRNQLNDLEKKYTTLRKKVAKLEKQPETAAENGELTESSETGIACYQAGTIVDVSQISWLDIDKYFQSYEIIEGDEVYNRIIGKSYQKNDNVALSDLRYLKVLHYNFEHQVQVGELIVNAKLVNDFISAFKSLYEQEYEIQSMYLIDNYWTGDGATSDNASIEVNNTSAFCYRAATGSTNLSNHAYGCAIDINSQQNPYVTYDADGNGSCYHENAREYLDRSSGKAHVITHDDSCFQIFTNLGFSWGGDWNTGIKDFQHFEKPVD